MPGPLWSIPPDGVGGTAGCGGCRWVSDSRDLGSVHTSARAQSAPRRSESGAAQLGGHARQDPRSLISFPGVASYACLGGLRAILRAILRVRRRRAAGLREWAARSEALMGGVCRADGSFLRGKACLPWPAARRAGSDVLTGFTKRRARQVGARLKPAMRPRMRTMSSTPRRSPAARNAKLCTWRTIAQDRIWSRSRQLREPHVPTQRSSISGRPSAHAISPNGTSPASPVNPGPSPRCTTSNGSRRFDPILHLLGERFFGTKGNVKTGSRSGRVRQGWWRIEDDVHILTFL